LSATVTVRRRPLVAIGAAGLLLGSSTAGASFSDVPPGAFYADAVAWAVEHGITTGVGGTGQFRPNDATTRGQMVTFLKRLDDKLARSARTNGNRLSNRQLATLSWYEDPSRSRGHRGNPARLRQPKWSPHEHLLTQTA
jgi:hypothetical protein